MRQEQNTDLASPASIWTPNVVVLALTVFFARFGSGLQGGVSINHITSVGMSLVAGTLLRFIGYEGLCWGAAGVILLSIPFALAIRTDVPAEGTAERVRA